MAERMLAWAPGPQGAACSCGPTESPRTRADARLGEGVIASGRLVPDCLSVKGLGNLAAHPLLTQGLLTAQGEASMLAVEAWRSGRACGCWSLRRSRRQERLHGPADG